jgi:hypothetical protein
MNAELWLQKAFDGGVSWNRTITFPFSGVNLYE